jgi:hypothetical protein
VDCGSLGEKEMIGQFLSVICWVILVSIPVLVGCDRGYTTKEEMPVRHPLVDPNFVMPDYVVRAFQASGGLQLWARTKQIRADGVVTFYKPSGSFYLTEFRCEIHPWPSTIVISVSEAQGEAKWSFSVADFKLLNEGRWRDAFPTAIRERDFLEAVLDIMIAPMRLLDDRALSTRVYNPVKKEGLWYYPIEQERSEGMGVRQYWSKVVFYQNRDSFLVDMIWFAAADREMFFAVRGYDYRATAEDDVLVPTKVEIFRTDARGLLKERLAKVDYYRFD